MKNKLTAIKKVSSGKNSKWLYQCECGKTTVANVCDVNSGNTKSCGCLRKESQYKKHGKYGTPLYKKWQTMKRRCCDAYIEKKYYKEKGIGVCDEWKEYTGFEKDMLVSYVEACANNTMRVTLDRIDNNKGYEPSNCRWVTQKINNRNKGNNRMIEFRGEKKCLTDWCEQYGQTRTTVSKRIERGWSVMRALTQQGNPSIKINKDIAEKIRKDSKMMSRNVVAEKYGVSKRLVQFIVQNKIWN